MPNHYKSRDYQFGHKILALRKKADLTQEEVGNQMGVSEKTIRNWEGGVNYPMEANLRKLVEIYLQRKAFPSGQEEEEARALWELFVESTSRHAVIFDAEWFGHVLKGQGLFSSSSTSMLSAQTSSLRHREDWGDALDVSSFTGRERELALLSRWVLHEQCRLVALLGLGGIGKTALATSFAQHAAAQFEFVLWRSLQNAPGLDKILGDCLQLFGEQGSSSAPQDVDQRLSLLVKLLREHRCLLVLDNVDTLFQEGERAGSYRQGYEAYRTFFLRVGTSHHQSCLLVTSRETLAELDLLAGTKMPARLLRMAGLVWEESRALLEDEVLVGEPHAWKELNERYAGNPLALKIVTAEVRELFGGDLATFLREGHFTFHGIRALLTQQVARLSTLEQEVLYWLAIERDLTGIERLRANMAQEVAPGDVLEALSSLHRRSLIERGERGAIFTLQPVVLEYMTGRLTELVCQEILAVRPALLLRCALMQAQARDYIRSSQGELILQEVLNRLLAQLRNPHRIEEHLDLVLLHLRTVPLAEQGYGGGNLVNLLVRLKGHLRGKDCSHLMIRQASLQEAEAQDANFAGADLRGSVFLETIEAISSVAVGADGQYIAAGGYNGEIRLWRVADGQLLLAWVGHNRLVWSLAFHPEGSWLVSGGYDGLVKVWDIRTGQCVRILQGHARWVKSLAFHPTGRFLATCGDDGSIRVWDLLADYRSSVWHQQESGIWSLAFSPDGKFLASGDVQGEIKLWDLESQQCLWSATAHPRSGELSQRAIPSVAFSPNGEVLVSGGQDATIRVWQTSSGAHLSTLFGHTATVHSVAFHAEGVLASGSEDRSVKLWQVGQCEEASYSLGTLYGHTDTIWSIACGPLGLLISGGKDDLIKIWQINKEDKGGRCLRTLRGYSRLINTMAFSPDGRLLISHEQNGAVRMWETTSGRCLHVLSRHSGVSFALAFCPDGRHFASGFSGNMIQLWDIESEQCLRTLPGHQGHIWSLAFSPDGRFLASSSLDTTIKLWEVNNGQCLGTFQGHHNWVWSVAYSPDGKLLASGDVDGIVKVWEVESGRCLHTLQGSPQAIVALRFTPDSQILLSSNAQDLVTLWDTQRGQCLKVIPGIGDTYWLSSVTLSADGNLVAARSHDQTVKIWDAKRGEIVRTLPCHAGQPWSVALSADRRLLACGTDQGSIMLWKMQTGEYLATLRGDRPYERMNIRNVTGITEAQKVSLKSLGAINEEESQSLENMSEHIYQPAELMTPVQVYRTLGIARQSLYDRLHKGRLTPIYQHGNLRLLRSEIEAWRRQREQKGRVETHEG